MKNIIKRHSPINNSTIDYINEVYKGDKNVYLFTEKFT